MLVLTDSTLANNTAQYGSGIDNYGTVIASRCTFSGNGASINGGALENLSSGNITLDNCTVFGNTSQGSGGGVRQLGNLTIVNSTISGNTAVTGGGLSRSNSASGTATLQNTIIA